MHDGIFKSFLRAFFVSLSVVFGLGFGLILLIGFFASLSDSTDGKDPEITYTYTPEIKPNALNVRKAFSSTLPVILKINIQGEIGGEELNRKTIEKLLVESREHTFKNNLVKAILLHIDSPGGTVVDAEGIYHMLQAYKKQYNIPIYAYVDGLCASGGLYIAAAADKIYASNSSLIGSVGVIISPIMNYSKALTTIGVETMTIYSGKGKDDLNPFRPWKADEGDNYKEIINYFYDQFVTSNRPALDKVKLITEYGAKVYPAPTAQTYGYIDESGASLNSTLSKLAKHIQIEDDAYQVIEMEGKTWLACLFKGKFNSGLLKGEIKHKLELSPHMDANLMGKPLYLYKPE
jgi:protease-4